MLDEISKIWYGFYSATAAAQYGYQIRKSLDNNEEVATTAIYNTIEEANAHYLWKDKICVGQVELFPLEVVPSFNLVWIKNERN